MATPRREEGVGGHLLTAAATLAVGVEGLAVGDLAPRTITGSLSFVIFVLFLVGAVVRLVAWIKDTIRRSSPEGESDGRRWADLRPAEDVPVARGRRRARFE